MTRGTLFYYEDDDSVWSSTEFNGDMYHGTHKNPEGIGDEVIELMTNLETLDDFNNVLAEINHHYKYEEGNDSYSINKTAIENSMKHIVEWIDKERPDLKDTESDPRTWKEKPSFTNVNTWRFWGVPNLSDYSYIYNNSGTDLVMNTKEDKTMTIPDGCLGVLNYGHNDCLCKDGMIIDGMGNYEEDKPRDIWNVHFGVRLTYDIKVEAETEEEAIEKAATEYEAVNYDDMEWVDQDINAWIANR